MTFFRMVLLTLLAAVPLISNAEVQRTTMNDQKRVSLTVYDQNIALVRDARVVPLKTGLLELEFLDVSSRIRPETSVLRSLSSPGSLQIRQLHFDHNLLTPQKLLESYVGKTVSVIRTHPTTGVETREQAEVISAQNGVVLRMGNRIETTVPGRIVFDRIPDDMRALPTLTFALNNKAGGNQKLELSYLTDGLSWKADYVAELNAADNQMDLSAWITLTNSSGVTYRNAQLQLISGNINQVYYRAPMPAMAAAAPMPAQQRDSVSEESFNDFHLYTIPQAVTIADNQARQLALFSASQVPVRKEWILNGNEYIYRSSQAEPQRRLRVGMFIEMKNRKGDNLGMPFPRGVVRFYRKDSQNNLLFVGEDQVLHTPVNDTIRLKLGDSFDVIADKTQTAFARVPETQEFKQVFQSSYEIVIRNAKKEAVTVLVREPIPGDWQIINASHTNRREGRIAMWSVPVPAQGSATLTYEVLTRF